MQTLISKVESTPFVKRYGSFAVVTGASDGIGKAFAEELAKRGMNVVLTARRGNVLDTLAKSLTSAYAVTCHVVACDLSTPNGVDTLIAQTQAFDVGLLVNAAGFGTAGDFIDASVEVERNMVDVNCTALMALSQHFACRFAARGRGGIVMLSSIVAFQGTPRTAHYAATKAYVQTLAEGLRVELSACNVDVLAVAPGPVATGFAARSKLKMDKAENPIVVARQSLDALGRRGLVRPGALAKILGYALACTPRFGRVAIMKKVMGAMTAHLPTHTK